MQSEAELSATTSQITLDRIFILAEAAREGPALITILQTLSLVRVTEKHTTYPKDRPVLLPQCFPFPFP
jgi:hypothetical protein